MIAYHGKEALKAERIERIREHRRQENLLQSFGYWIDGKGCAVGCTVESGSNPHARYETEMGIPRAIAFVEDSTFEGLPEAEAMAWPERFLAAIPVGADLSKVLNHFSAWMLAESGLLTITDTNREAIATVAALHARAAAGEEIDAGQWRSAARSAARSAWSAARSAWSAARSAWSAARSAESAESAAWSAESAARSAESAARSAWSAARSAAWSKIADKLIELLAAAPVQVGAV